MSILALLMVALRNFCGLSASVLRHAGSCLLNPLVVPSLVVLAQGLLSGLVLQSVCPPTQIRPVKDHQDPLLHVGCLYPPRSVGIPRSSVRFLDLVRVPMRLNHGY